MSPEAVDPPLSYALTRLARQLSRALADVHIPELSGPEVVALLTLKREAGLSGAQLARRCFVTAQAMSEVVLDLERRGLLTRAPDPRNQRILRARLTPAGRRIIRAVERRIADVEAQLLEGFTPQEAETFRAGVVRAARNLGLPPGVPARPAAD